MSLLIDDGVVTKENRYNLLNPAHLFTGPYSGTHFTEGHLSCMVFVGGWTPNVDDKTTVLDDAAYRAIDDEFFTELNKVRLDPTSLVADLEAMLPRFTETSYKDYGKFAISTTEGADAVNDAIAFLQSASPT